MTCVWITSNTHGTSKNNYNPTRLKASLPAPQRGAIHVIVGEIHGQMHELPKSDKNNTITVQR